MSSAIHIEKARTHNLREVTVDIPRNQLTVITGVSGSGKSSLAFDTLYAEGQRRYVESLSAYARQFMGRIQKPDVESIEGIPPAIAIQQKVTSRNPRSTVGTVTETYDYLKLLFARIGHTYSPISGTEVKRHSVNDVVQAMLSQPLHSRLYLLTPIHLKAGQTLHEKLQQWLSMGFSRLFYDGDIFRIESKIQDADLPDKMMLLVDRVITSEDPSLANRFADSVQTAYYEGEGECSLFNDNTQTMLSFSEHFEQDGIRFIEPTEHLFDFNNPLGACPNCNGYGIATGIDHNLVVPDKTLSIYEDAIACWKGPNLENWKNDLIKNAALFDFPIHTPFYDLTEAQKQLLWTGNEYFRGLNEFFQEIDRNQSKRVQYRVLLARYSGKTTCPVCNGLRLRKEASYVRINGKSITDLIQMPVTELIQWFDSLTLPDNEAKIAQLLLQEIRSRLLFMQDVGLSYLTLNRAAASLSGGESQRISIAKSLGSSLVGSLYVLDEPSIGLHPRDTAKLIHVLQELRDLNNTIVVVEHDEDIIAAADYIVEIGPKAGTHGGQLMYAGVPIHKPIPYIIPPYRRPWNNYIELIGASQNNLRNLTVRFPLNVMTVVTGVSGSGKSTLVSRIFYPALKTYLGGSVNQMGSFKALKGSLHLVKNAEFIDQNPLTRSTRSNPATYIKAYDDIRALYAEQQLSKQLGFAPAHFSFNTPGGRCELCKGEGTITVEMQFMADLILPCEQCHGKRFKQDVLDVLYNGKSIYDILEMTVDEALEFFGPDPKCRSIVKRLQALQDVGIGYVKLGQSASTLSGGESQRVKLAYFLAQEDAPHTLFVFDEPTTGLSHQDIDTLLKALNRLVSKGHTLLIIEHNPAIIAAADHIIDLGPEGGDEGGQIVFEGTPEQLMDCPDSYTGRFLKQTLRHD